MGLVAPAHGVRWGMTTIIAEIHANGGHAAIPPDPWTTAAARAHGGARWRRFRA